MMRKIRRVKGIDMVDMVVWASLQRSECKILKAAKEDTMKNVILAILILVICETLAGCGETVSGVGKDVNRMGQGINTFFFRQQ